MCVIRRRQPSTPAVEKRTIDLLIEVSGDASLKRRLKDAFIQEGNRHTIIMHDLIARMMISLVEGSDALAPSFHPEDVGIG